MTPQEQEFYALLETQANCAEDILNALKTEKENLRLLDPTEVTHSTQDKIGKIQALEKSSSLCMNWLKQSSPNKEITLNIREYIQTIFPNNQVMLDLLDRIKTLAEACQRQNEVNGGVVALSQQYTERALAILHGDTPRAKLYGKEGRAHQTYSPKTLGRV